MPDLSLVYYGHVFDATGYGQAARGYLHALHAAGVELSVVDLMKHDRQVRDELIESLVGRRIDPDFHLFHGIPPQWARLAFPLRNAIGMTVWETDTMPPQWRNVLSHVVEVWLPCDFNISAFSRDLSTPIFKLPHVVVPSHTNGHATPAVAFPDVRHNDFVFYAVFEWQDRKGPAELLTAYLRAFSDTDATVLVVKTSPVAGRAAEQALAAARERTSSGARIVVCADAWNEAQLEALHRRGDCYVSLHRGEGWCYPLFDAATRGTPVVATGYAGPLEYLSADFAELVPYQLVPVRQPYLYYHPTMRWAEPDILSAAERLRWVYMNRDAARTRAAAAAVRIRERYAPEAVGHLAREQLVRTLQRTNVSRFRRLQRARLATSAKPPVPIPGDWYDAGYFEDGIKSNWRDGYTWASFAGVFSETAAFLADMFPDATTYLDVGCAKGFLVRALRSLGRECWGIDHSAWAIDHADALALPYVTCASAEEISADRQFDFVLAFGLLPHLTEWQAEAFLKRARALARVGLVAVIRSFETDEDERQYREANDDDDLSHILMRTRAWWHDLFLRAGWRQDPLHRALERACRNHELPRKMGWQLYVYAAS
jgi:2-polyprenyl-3-methyl-5-hydroxy-6-metoxy-1,4-benzoquinol methylase